MKTFVYKVKGHEFKIVLNEAGAEIKEFKVDNEYPEIVSEEMPAYAAVISLALLEDQVTIVHDDEPGVITLKPVKSPWNNPADLMHDTPALKK